MRLAFLFIASLLLAEVGSIVTTPPPYLDTVTFLYVDSFDGATIANWIAIGSSPFINEGTDNSIRAIGVGNCSWFGFPNIGATPSQVYLDVLGLSSRSGTDDHAAFYLNDGAMNSSGFSINFDVRNTWKSVNVTSYLNTTAKVNAARLLIESNLTGLNRVCLSIVRLRIYYENEPVLETSGITSYRINTNATVYSKWYCENSLSTYTINHNVSGSWLATNITGTLSGTVDWCNATIALNNTAHDVLAVQFWVNSSSDKWQTSGQIYYPMIFESFDLDTSQVIGNATSWSNAEPSMRHTIYAEHSGYYYHFWTTDAQNTTVYSFTQDGKTWSPPTLFKSYPYNILGGGVIAYEYRDGSEYIHHAFGAFWNSGQGHDLEYCRATILSNGTLQWDVTHTAVAAETAISFMAWGLTVTPSGYVFLTYTRQNQTDNTWSAWLTHTQATDGSWNTASGYPLNATCSYAPTGNEQMATDIAGCSSDRSVYVIVSARGHVIQGRKVLDGAFESIENITTETPLSTYFFSAVSESGNIHLAYVDNQATISFRYCFRNFTTNSWTTKGELITSNITQRRAHDTYSFPATTWGKCNNLFIVNWLTDESYLGNKTNTQPSAWRIIRNGTAWEPEERINYFADYLAMLNPNQTPMYSYNSVLYTFELETLQNGTDLMYAHLYTVKQNISLSTGWEDTNPNMVDVGRYVR